MQPELAKWRRTVDARLDALERREVERARETGEVVERLAARLEESVAINLRIERKLDALLGPS